ncbi:MAG: HAMP domain-containing sensor histidine kinase [Thermoguttaceae bacterium]|nr:HAMP domain-containing sensor histidine kinase [Thermoguttaceae bacterium]
MAERTAAWLGGKLLRGNPPFSDLADLLTPLWEDPPFGSWVVLNYWYACGSLPSWPEELLEWFRTGWPRLLSWPSDRPYLPPAYLLQTARALAEQLRSWIETTRREILDKETQFSDCGEPGGRSIAPTMRPGAGDKPSEGHGAGLGESRRVAEATSELPELEGGPRESWSVLQEPATWRRYTGLLLEGAKKWAFTHRDGRWEPVWRSALAAHGTKGGEPAQPESNSLSCEPQQCCWAGSSEKFKGAPRDYPPCSAGAGEGRGRPIGLEISGERSSLPDGSKCLSAGEGRWDGFWDIELGEASADGEAGVAATFLPVLAAKIGRLWELESLFHSQLEEAKVEALAEFSAGAAHELNNPLAIISGRAQLLLRSESQPDRRRDLATIIVQADRAREMLADLRLFARPPLPEYRRVDLRELLAELVAGFRSECESRAVDVFLIAPDAPVFCRIDPVQIRVAVLAICRNALEAIGEKGVIEVRLVHSEQEVRIEVSDNGPGVPAEMRSKVFDPFFSGRQAGRGLGFGLCKAWRIAKNHGGSIRLESLAGEGTLVVLRLPVRV